ncbi:hypothetical protein M9H77_28685 [Catharanthus roseus]|uniref:Uncharacterized protein n=1 Tax=Catharanthus roseus TaxID=4058 RepID=A0ACC0AG19_CATRO|nr:hypothetical protein M9H77_28685 [Catharanthus roseus]
MAILETTPRKETAMPTTPRKTGRAMAAFFSFNHKTTSSVSSFSNYLSPPTPTHTFSESMMEENIENAEEMIMKWDPKGSSFTKFVSLFQEDRKEAKEFIKCVKGLRRAMHFLISEHSGSSKLVLAQNLMQIAMKRLEKEFYQILSANREHLNPESVSSRSSRLSLTESSNSDDENEAGSDEQIRAAGESISEVERLSVIAMSDLRLIAECMVSSGYGKECINIYKKIRASIVEETLYRLGIERYSSSQINKLNPEALDNQIKVWLNAVRIAVTTLFHGERFLCDHVFAISDSIRESCFTDISKDGAVNLFRFPEIVAKGKRSPEKVFMLMSLYEAISEVWPEIESIFSFQSVLSVKIQALSSLDKLGDSVQTIIIEFESSIQKNSSRIAVPGGGIHPLTNSVMSYVSLLANYSSVLSDIFLAGSASPTQMPFPESYFESPDPHEADASAVSVRLAWIILVLLCKLDRKAEIYNDIALSYLFLANNLHFVLENVRTTNLKILLGDHWVAKLERKVKLYAQNYESMAWNKVFSCLPEKSQATISPDMVMTHFQQFKTAFEAAYNKQISWMVPDAKLRDEIKVSIARKLVPAYREFYNTHLTTLMGKGNSEVLLRFSPDNIGNYLSDLLHGNEVPGDSSTSNSQTSRCLPYVVKCD